jgi:hypothetical protein
MQLAVTLGRYRNKTVLTASPFFFLNQKDVEDSTPKYYGTTSGVSSTARSFLALYHLHLDRQQVEVKTQNMNHQSVMEGQCCLSYSN